MDSAKKLNQSLWDCVLLAVALWLQDVEKFESGIGPIKEAVAVINGGKLNQNGTATGKINFPTIGKEIIHHSDDGEKTHCRCADYWWLGD
jgi:hypothetical protein